MSLKTTTVISIENKIQESTGKPFGSKYSGTFTIRRPSLLDKRTIAIKNAASLAAHGDVPQEALSDGINLIGYIFTFMETVAEAPMPKWFDMAEMFDPEDEEALLAVWTEVGTWLDSFRAKRDSATGE